MQAVILAAGKGTRLAPLTDTTPKPLIKLHGKALIDHVIEGLPSIVDDIIVITGHHGDKLERHLDAHIRSGVRCVSQGDMSGTYGALKSATTLLSGDFLVINGDDIQSAEELEEVCRQRRVFCVSSKIMQGYHSIETDTAGMVVGMHPQTPDQIEKGAMIATGTYMLDMGFFDLVPQQMKNGEYGIPHTLLAAKAIYPMKTFEVREWRPINTHDDLEQAGKEMPRKPPAADLH